MKRFMKYKCEHCGREFDHSSECKEHEKTHVTNERILHIVASKYSAPKFYMDMYAVGLTESAKRGITIRENACSNAFWKIYVKDVTDRKELEDAARKLIEAAKKAYQDTIDTYTAQIKSAEDTTGKLDGLDLNKIAENLQQQKDLEQ